ncbi:MULTISPECIES: hypothetical protein [unclassified Mesorhizobium]|nr:MULTISPECIES: hypothetical protein [unclassified Mesorhizobium]
MAETDKDLDETRRIMERLVKTPPDPNKASAKPGKKPVKKEEKPAD